MSHSRVRPPPEEDLQPAVHDEIRKPIAEQRPGASPPPAGAGHGLEAGRADYFGGKYGGGPPAKSPAEMSLSELLARFQLPENLAACISRLIAVARAHGAAEALVAAGKDPALDSNHRGHARQLISFVFAQDHQRRA